MFDTPPIARTGRTREYPSCRCRKHLRWTMNGKRFRRKAGTRSWKTAQENVQRLIAELVKSDEPEKAL